MIYIKNKVLEYQIQNYMKTILLMCFGKTIFLCSFKV